MMEAEHESAGQALTGIRQITRDFEVPEYACVTYRALMSGLDELERDLHMHIHLENNILFPRAERLEAASR
jgi:regulator of cell morphogenesis and NO signaling